MFSERITVFLFLSLFFAQVSQITASNISTPVAPTTTNTVFNSSSINNANSSSSNYSSSISPAATFLPTTMPLHPTTGTPPTKSTVKPPPTPQACRASGEPTKESTCSLFTVKHNFTWIMLLKNESSSIYQDIKANLLATFCNVLKNHEFLVVLFEMTLNKAEGGGTIANVTLCLNLSEGVDLEEVLRNNTEISTFEVIGVSYSDWKPKDGECKKCGEDGGGGPIVIEGVCKSETYSCRGGHEKKSQETDDCVKYCPSASSLVVAAVSNLILTLWISLSFK